MGGGYVRLPAGWARYGASGPWPFTTREVQRGPDGRERVWESRRHRKARCRLTLRWEAGHGRPARYWWAPQRLAWWIGVLFMIGSACFAVASLPGAAEVVPPAAVAGVYFGGSVFFTMAAYLQHLEAINAEREDGPGGPVRLVGVELRRIDWWASLIQLVGTVFFNVTTFAAMIERLGTPGEELLVWAPDAVGSVCFLVASQLAFAEVCHRMACWRGRDLEWWIVALNLLGSIAFGISAIAAFVVPDTGELLNAAAATSWTLLGAICFLLGAYLLLPEAGMAEEEDRLEVARGQGSPGAGAAAARP